VAGHGGTGQSGKRPEVAQSQRGDCAVAACSAETLGLAGGGGQENAAGLTSFFVVVEVRAPRFGPCDAVLRRTIAAVAEFMPCRCTPESERTFATMGALLPYRRALSLSRRVLLARRRPEVETIRQRTVHVGTRLEMRQWQPSTPVRPTAAQSIALVIEGRPQP